jgi:membrane-associated protease RseP (regulator of RpoE activity)
MINLDMIGRLRDTKIYVGGTGTGSNFAALVQSAGRHSGLTNDLSENGGYGASDHTSFTTKRIPTLFFFTGLHSDYHKPSDTWDKINAAGGAQVLREVAEVAASIADAPLRPAFVTAAPSPHSGGVPGGAGSGYGPYFGSVPDFGQTEAGVKFADVREGSPAAKAGLKAGDILVEFAGKKVQNLYDFTYLLREHKPSDVVHVKVMRDRHPIEVDVTLTERR